jgi:branched-chain amino acid transport system substrate-binding protein
MGLITDEASAVRIGVCLDNELNDIQEDYFLALRAGIRDSGVDRPVDLVIEIAKALPKGTASALEEAYANLVSAGVVAIVGPSISDNCFIARDLADAARVPTLNWSGHEATRSEYCYQFQVGSLEEEPILLVEYLHRQGVRRVALVEDRSAIGSQYAKWFHRRRTKYDLEVAVQAMISPVATDGVAILELIRQPGVEAIVYLGLGLSAYPLAVAKRQAGWDILTCANTALMWPHMNPFMRDAYDGWVYVDMFSDRNPVLAALRTSDPAPWQRHPIGICSYDMGRIVGEALNAAPHHSRQGLQAGMQQVKQLPAACGSPGTTMTLGTWDRAALKGPYLVLRRWTPEKTVEHLD